MIQHRLSPWRVIASSYPLSNRWLRVRLDRCLTALGVEIPDYYVVERPDFVMVFALTPSDEVLIVGQYKHGSGRVVWELPAGQIETGEEPAEAARRELFEETGYRADEMEALGVLDMSPATATTRAWAYLCRSVRYEGGHVPDVAEEIAVERVPLSALPNWLGREKIRDAASVAISYLALRQLTAHQGSTEVG